MTPMHEFSLIYATFPSKELALKVVRECVEAKLVACANVLGEVKSVYEWKGKLCEEGEFVAFLKTTHASAEAAIEKIKSLHPYECPCIIVLPVLGGNPEFLKWMSSNVHKSINNDNYVVSKPQH